MFTLDQMHEFNEDSLPTEYFKMIKNKCPFCKHPIVINNNRTIMKCSNYYCPEHMSHRASNMFTDMGIDRIGPGKAYDIIVKNNLKTHLDILGLSLTDLPNKFSEEHKRQIYISLQKGREQTLDSIFTYFQIDNIGEKKATQIVEGYSSFKDFFGEHNTFEKLLEHFRKSLNQSDYTETLIKMAYHTFVVKEDLMRVEDYFKVTKLTKDKIRVCITGDVLTVYSPNMVFKPRKNFIDLLNKKYEGIISFINSGTNLSDSDFLLTDSTKKTSKYKSAMELNVPIKTFSEFVDSIEKAFGEGDKQIIINRRN